MKVLSTDGAILNLSRFEALRIYDAGGNPVDPATVREIAESHPRYRFLIFALSGLGRSDEPTKTLVAESGGDGILAVWEILVGVDRKGPFDLAAVIARAEAGAAIERKAGIR